MSETNGWIQGRLGPGEHIAGAFVDGTAADIGAEVDPDDGDGDDGDGDGSLFLNIRKRL